MTDTQSPRRRWSLFLLPGHCSRAAGWAIGWVLIGMLRTYQRLISPLLPRVCRFQPTCSQYMVEAIRRRGPVMGMLKGLWRVVRCNPFCKGGYDPVE